MSCLGVTYPIATYPLGNFGGVLIYSINDIFNTIVSAFDFGDGVQGIRETSIHTDNNGRQYFIRYQHKYYIDEFVRCV